MVMTAYIQAFELFESVYFGTSLRDNTMVKMLMMAVKVDGRPR
jgi:hypothetical protein